MDRDALIPQLKSILIEDLNLEGQDPATLDEHAPLFGEGLGLDSLDALQLAMSVEERFGVRIPEGDAGRAAFASLAALAEYIHAHDASVGTSDSQRE